MSWTSISDTDVAGKRVLLRVDLNVPMEEGRVADATRIERTVPTIRSITSEHSTGMIRLTFSALPRRRSVLVAKAVIVGGIALVTALVATAMS